MRAKIEISPAEFPYIAILEPGDWERAADKACEILNIIGARGVVEISGDDATSVDTRWWGFSFKGGSFRIVCEEWPNGLSIEPRNAGRGFAVVRIEKLIPAA
ncbi:hypothetical protein MAFF211271_36530 (plasmid) [Ralstonia syzygii subsp. indonesiensis]|nr:hypothetical protein MAFF211271_36530 [Ralstonia pseudosolanacearum]